MPKERRHVQMSASVETALAVGARRGGPVILTVNAAQMHDQGLQFYRSANGVWLTAHVAPQFIGFGESGPSEMPVDV